MSTYPCFTEMYIANIFMLILGCPFIQSTNNTKLYNRQTASQEKSKYIQSTLKHSNCLKADTPKWRMCFFKVCNMWIGHIILIHSNSLGVKSSRRIDASLVLCQTCAFYLVTRQPCCLINIAEPAGNSLLHYFVGDTGKQLLKCSDLKHNSPLDFQCKFTYLDHIFS